MIKGTVAIENAKIGIRNFSGKEGQFNPKGRRNFCVFLDDEIASELKEDGWNVKLLQPKNPDDDPQPYLQIRVAFNYYPPKIVLINSTNKTVLNEDTVHILDWADIEGADIIFRPYNWDVSGKKGITAYLKVMYVTVAVDEFEEKYKDLPDSAKDYVDDEAPF